MLIVRMFVRGCVVRECYLVCTMPNNNLSIHAISIGSTGTVWFEERRPR
jgi:hypothetical protein